MWNSHCSIRCGSDTCRNPLGSFSLRTSKQYSIMPVVWRSFMVQCVIWSRTIWNECEREVRQTRHGVGPTEQPRGLLLLLLLLLFYFTGTCPDITRQQQVLFLALLLHLFNFFLVPIDIRCYLLVHT